MELIASDLLDAATVVDPRDDDEAAAAAVAAVTGGCSRINSCS